MKTRIYLYTYLQYLLSMSGAYRYTDFRSSDLMFHNYELNKLNFKSFFV